MKQKCLMFVYVHVEVNVSLSNEILVVVKCGNNWNKSNVWSKVI